MNRYFISSLITLMVLHTGRSPSYGNVDQARIYLTEANVLFSANDIFAASNKLELAGAELEEAAGADKNSVLEQIKILRSKIAEVVAAADRKKYVQQLELAMSELARSIGDLTNWPIAESRVISILDNVRIDASIPTEINAARQKLTALQTQNAEKARPLRLAVLQNELDKIKSTWTDLKKKLASSEEPTEAYQIEIDQMDQSLLQFRQQVMAHAILIGNSSVATFNAEIKLIGDDFLKNGVPGRVAEVVEALSLKAPFISEDCFGWEDESTGPSWDEYVADQSENLSAFYAPKTRNLIARTDTFLAALPEERSYLLVAEEESIKLIVNNARETRERAYKKMLGLVTATTEQAMKSKVEDIGKFNQLIKDVAASLGENSPEGLAIRRELEARVKSLNPQP